MLSLFRSWVQREIGGIKLDAVVFEGLDHPQQVTKFPVELGSEITDNVILQNRVYTMRGLVTDTPTRYKDTEYQNADQKTRSLAALSLLDNLRVSREPFDLLDGMFLYRNMVFQRLTASREGGRDDNQVRFEATLEQIRIVETRTTRRTDFNLAAGPAADQAGDQENTGKRTGDEPEQGGVLFEAAKKGLELLQGFGTP